MAENHDKFVFDSAGNRWRGDGIAAEFSGLDPEEPNWCKPAPVLGSGWVRARRLTVQPTMAGQVAPSCGWLHAARGLFVVVGTQCNGWVYDLGSLPTEEHPGHFFEWSL